MDRLKVNPKNRSLLQGGKPFFYLADTLWMAFSKLEMNEWEEILQLRRQQRFTVVQISALPISHDNSSDEEALMPFLPGKDQAWDFDAINTKYFDKACQMLQMAVDYGLMPCIHLLWANYVPDTWASKHSPETAMPLQSALDYVKYAVSRFSPYQVIYSVSGDTGFETEKVSEYYDKAIKIIRKEDPKALLTLHLNPQAQVPPPLAEQLDFFTFQGGHCVSGDQHNYHYRLAQYYWNRPENKPVINTEPPYDGHGFGFEYGRHGTADIRRAMWQSLLSGAQAGTAYGAHGLWSMHRAGQAFTSVAFSGHPFDWRYSLRLPGAWEPGFMRDLWEQYSLFNLKPMDDLISHSAAIRLAKNDEWYALYVPYPSDVTLPFAIKEGQEIVLYDLTYRRRMQAEVNLDTNTLLTPQANTDVLYLIKRA